MADNGQNAERTKVDNFWAVIIHVNQCNICSYIEKEITGNNASWHC